MQDKEFEANMQDVARAYGSPAELAKSDNLTRRQKLRLLQQWDYDLGLLLVAAEENMTGPGSGATSELMRSVRHAIAGIGAEGDPDTTVPSKVAAVNIPELEGQPISAEPNCKPPH